MNRVEGLSMWHVHYIDPPVLGGQPDDGYIHVLAATLGDAHNAVVARHPTYSFLSVELAISELWTADGVIVGTTVTMDLVDPEQREAAMAEMHAEVTRQMDGQVYQSNAYAPSNIAQYPWRNPIKAALPELSPADDMGDEWFWLR